MPGTLGPVQGWVWWVRTVKATGARDSLQFPNLRASLWLPASCPTLALPSPQRYQQEEEAGGTRICHLENKSRLRDCACFLETSPNLGL